jgi:hypothetical protein
VKEATDFETRLLEDRIVTDRYRIQEWRNGEITMTGKQMENKERPNYDDKVQSDGISQVHETGVADHSLFGAEEPTTKPVQASNRTSRYGKPVATSRVPISKDT